MSITITVRNNNVEQALRVLKKKCQKDGLLKDLRQRHYYEQPCDKRHRKKKEMIKACKKREKKLAAIRGY